MTIQKPTNRTEAESNMILKQKTILITGASSGIGKAVALALSKQHCRIAITARRQQELVAVAEIIRQNGSEALVLPGDALDEESAFQVVKETVARFGCIDIALLNIGAGPALNTANVSPADVKQNMRVNYDSMVNFFVPLVQQMKIQPEGGIIAHTNSLAGFLGMPMQGPYSAAKAACRIFLDTARIELREFKIRVLTICPGFVITERNKHRGIPKLFTMSETIAAQQILKALRLEIREYLFPTSLKFGILAYGFLPRFISERMLNRF